jgi:hypothetical protein
MVRRAAFRAPAGFRFREKGTAGPAHVPASLDVISKKLFARAAFDVRALSGKEPVRSI